jgi:phosphocarrier protein
MQLEATIEITNKYGLHARSSTRLAQVAQKYRAKILVSRKMTKGGQDGGISEEVDAKSVLCILSLGAECGDSVRFRVEGEDAQAALNDLTELVRRKFFEE